MASTSASGADSIETPTRPSPPVKDVWSRSGSKYRFRAIVLLAVNVLMFAGVGSFAYWLRTGIRFAPAQQGYVDEFLQTFRTIPMVEHGASGVSLGSLLLKPISVQEVPMQIPIFGLLMAALIATPILVAILYRFWSSLPFVAVVGFLAVMPWLAVTLLCSCVLASVRPFRTRFRFVSALLALVPAVIYLTLAWFGTAEEIVGEIDPRDRMKFVAPWVLAIVAAAVVFAVVLSIAKLVDYRPGAIAPLLAVMLGLPVVLFETRVGRDELYYRLLETARDAYFSDIDGSRELDRAVFEAWYRHPHPRPSMEAVRQTEQTRWLFELASDIEPVRSAMVRYQMEIADRADWFLTFFPHSRYAPNSLYIKASALDMRADAGEFRRTRWVRFYDGFPSSASHDTWRIILENRPDTALGAVALLRLAQLEARNGDVERAMSKLSTLLTRFDRLPEGEDAPAPDAAGAFQAVLARNAPEVGLGISMERILLEAHRLFGLLRKNRDPIYGYDPICGSRARRESFSFGLLDLDPRNDRYVENLRILKGRYPNCQAMDNIDLEIAKATSSNSQKIQLLGECLSRYPDRDAAAEALFRLGVALKADQQTGRSDEVLARLMRNHPGSIWSKRAQRYVPTHAAMNQRTTLPASRGESG